MLKARQREEAELQQWGGSDCKTDRRGAGAAAPLQGAGAAGAVAAGAVAAGLLVKRTPVMGVRSSSGVGAAGAGKPGAGDAVSASAAAGESPVAPGKKVGLPVPSVAAKQSRLKDAKLKVTFKLSVVQAEAKESGAGGRRHRV